jgi:hypothetical protein
LLLANAVQKTACEEVDGRRRWKEETLLMDDQNQNYDTQHHIN